MTRIFKIRLLSCLVLCAVCLGAFSAQAAVTSGGVVYAVSGNDGPNPPVVLIPGWACDYTVWNLQVPALEKQGKVVVFDLPGHGQSTRLRVQYTPQYFAAAILSVLDKEHIGRAVLVGHSMGFAVARMFAIMYPERCLALCDVDGVYESLPGSAEERAAYFREIRDFIAPIHGDGTERTAFVWNFVDSLFVPATPERLRRRIRGMMLSCPRHVADSAMDNLFTEEVWQPHPMPGLPVLAISSDMPGVPADLEAQLQREYPKVSFHVVPGTGHFLMMERPEPVNRLLLDFLKTLPAG